MTDTTVAVTTPSGRAQFFFGAGLLAATFAEVLAIAHHPHVVSRDVTRAGVEIVAVSPLAGLIHGVAIGSSLLVAYCLGEIVFPQVPSRMARAAALAYGGGLAAVISAATVDGWVLERLAAVLPHVTPMDLDGKAEMFKLCGAWVLASANIGAVMTSCGVVIASSGLLRNSRRWQIAGGLGLATGLVVSLGIVFGRLAMDGRGVLGLVVLQAVWPCVIGIVALTGTSRRRPT